MNMYVKEFIKRGLLFSGLGPLVVGIVYLILELSKVEIRLSGLDVFLAIIATYIIAFVQAGSSVFEQIESWSSIKSIFFHMTSIYVVYLGGYLINRWIPFDYLVIIIFTSVYIVTFLIIWLFIYFITKRTSDKMNKKLIQFNGGMNDEWYWKA